MMPPKWGDNAFKQCRVAPRCILCIHKSKSKVLLANSSPSHSRLFSNTIFVGNQDPDRQAAGVRCAPSRRRAKKTPGQVGIWFSADGPKIARRSHAAS